MSCTRNISKKFTPRLQIFSYFFYALSNFSVPVDTYSMADINVFLYILDASLMCPPPGKCYFEPEQTCEDHLECTTSSDRYIAFCCPHDCKGKKICRDFRCKCTVRNIKQLFSEVVHKMENYQKLRMIDRVTCRSRNS